MSKYPTKCTICGSKELSYTYFGLNHVLKCPDGQITRLSEREQFDYYLENIRPKANKTNRLEYDSSQ